MRRAVTLLALLASASALADWYGVQVPGRPNDATIISADGGVVVIATTDGLFHIRDGGVRAELRRGTDVTWGTLDGGCLTGYTRGGSRVACDGSATLLGATTPTVFRVAQAGANRYLFVLEAGSLKVAHDDRLGNFTFVGPTPANAFPTFPGNASSALAAWQRGGVSHAVASLQFGRFATIVDAGYTDVRLDAGVTFLEVDTFTEGFSDMLLIASSVDGGGDAIAIQNPDTDPFARRVSTPADVSSVTGIAFESQTNSSNAFADGHGMACGQTAAGSVVLQPIPDPLNPAGTWVANSAQSAVAPAGRLTRVRCDRGRLCVVLTELDAGTNVFIYENRGAPQFASTDGGTVASGQTAVFTISAADPDGDPIVFDAGFGALNDGGTSRLLDAGVVEFTAGTVCSAPKDVTASFGASDGVFNSSQTFKVTITPANPAQPAVAPTVLDLEAGSDAGRVEVTRVAGVCQTTGVNWTLVDAGSVTFASVGIDGDSRVFTPPSHYCSATAGEALFRVTATNAATKSDPVPVTVRVNPWGPPARPFDADIEISLDAGFSITLTRDGGHFCGAAAESSLVTLWELPPLDGGVRATVSASTAQLSLATSPCVSATFDIPVRSEIAGRTSPLPHSVVHVKVTPNLAVSNVGLASLSGTELDGGLLITAATDFVCAGAIGLSANVYVSRGGEPVADGGLQFTPSSGSTFFPLPDCAGGTFDVAAFLVEADGGQSNVSRTTTVTVPAGVVPAPTVISEASTVTCAGGGRASMSIVARPRCSGLGHEWKQVLGIPVSLPDGGEDIVIRTESADLGEIIGQSVSIQVTPISGARRFPSTIEEVTFEHRPFVDVKHETDAPIAADTELFGITVTLTNNESCEVRGVDYVETLTETRAIPASVRVNGEPIDESRIVIGSRTMAIKGLSLPPGEPVEIYYSARPVLFGAPKPTGKAVLRFGQATEYDISQREGFAREPGTNPPGCGCSAGSGGVFALLALVALCRRRRSQR